MKAAIIVLSDPKGGEEALGRLFNALAAAYDFKQKKKPVEVFFQGAGTRWAAALAQPEHPAHGLYTAVRDTVVGASSGCADAFGARQDVEKTGMQLLRGNAVPGTSGLPSLERLVSEGYTVLTF